MGLTAEMARFYPVDLSGGVPAHLKPFAESIARQIQARLIGLGTPTFSDLSAAILGGNISPGDAEPVMGLVEKLQKTIRTGRVDVDWRRLKEQAPLALAGNILDLICRPDGLVVAETVEMSQAIVVIDPWSGQIMDSVSCRYYDVQGVTSAGDVIMRKTKDRQGGKDREDPYGIWTPGKTSSWRPCEAPPSSFSNWAWLDPKTDRLYVEQGGEPMNIYDARTARKITEMKLPYQITFDARLIGVIDDNLWIIQEDRAVAVIESKNHGAHPYTKYKIQGDEGEHTVLMLPNLDFISVERDPQIEDGWLVSRWVHDANDPRKYEKNQIAQIVLEGSIGISPTVTYDGTGQAIFIYDSYAGDEQLLVLDSQSGDILSRHAIADRASSQSIDSICAVSPSGEVFVAENNIIHILSEDIV